MNVFVAGVYQAYTPNLGNSHPFAWSPPTTPILQLKKRPENSLIVFTSSGRRLCYIYKRGCLFLITSQPVPVRCTGNVSNIMSKRYFYD